MPKPIRTALAALALAALAGSAGAATFVYVSNSESQNLSVFSLRPENGALVPVATVAAGGAAMPLALSASTRRLYVGLRSAPYRVASFAIDPLAGTLSPLGEAPLADSMAYLALERGGRYLLSASYGGAKFSVNPVGADGLPGAPQQDLAAGPKAHAILASPDNRYVFGVVLGADQLLRYRLDPASGQLSEQAVALTLAPQSGPRFFRFSPDGRFVYLIDELDGKLHALAYDAASGKLEWLQSVSVMPDGFAGKPWAADLHLTPDGRFLYTSERSSSTLSGYRVDRRTGRLSRFGSWPTESQPRGFAIAPSGQFLLAAGEKSGHVGVYRIGAQGQLQALGRYPAGSGPSWIEIADFE